MLLAQARDADALHPCASPRAFTDYVEGELVAVEDPAAAIPLYLSAIQGARSVGANFVDGIASVALASARTRTGDHAGAAEMFEHLLGYWSATGHGPQLWTTARNAVPLLVAHDRTREAALLLLHADRAPRCGGGERADRPPQRPRVHLARRRCSGRSAARCAASGGSDADPGRGHRAGQHRTRPDREHRLTPAGTAARGRENGRVSDSTHQDGVGEPDALDRLWTPHRIAYIRGESKPADDSEGECPFCRIPSLDDADGLVVRRGELAFVVLNLYPYAPGHLMICPYRHIADYTETSEEEAEEIGHLTKQAMHTLRGVSAVQGFNIGMNQGAVAGAGIAAHLHQHVVPRWLGDQNFMPIIGQTKTLPELLTETRSLLAQSWEDLVS